MRPFNASKGPKDIDESTDTYDSIEWLLKNISNNNGRAGIIGISQPGFHVAARCRRALHHRDGITLAWRMNKRQVSPSRFQMLVKRRRIDWPALSPFAGESVIA